MNYFSAGIARLAAELVELEGREAALHEIAAAPELSKMERRRLTALLHIAEELQQNGGAPAVTQAAL